MIWNIGLGIPAEGIGKYLNEIGLRYCDKVYIESEEQAHRIFTKRQHQNYNNKFKIFHKGIDTKRFNPDAMDGDFLDEGGFKVGTAASLIPRKGHDVFLRMATKVIDKTEDEVHFYIAGDVPSVGDVSYRDELMVLIEKYGLEEQVTLLGWVEEMPRYLKSLDIFVLASKNEGIPGVVREAMAMEVPVIATDVGGTSEAVIHDETGYLINPENAKQIPEKVLGLLSDQSKRMEFGKEGRKHVIENFSIETYIRDYEEFLKEITE